MTVSYKCLAQILTYLAENNELLAHIILHKFSCKGMEMRQNCKVKKVKTKTK